MRNDPILKNLRRHFSQALIDHQMIQAGDHILVGLSGGKDSWALLGLLADLQPRAPIAFTLSAVTVDGGLTGLEPRELEKGCQRLGVPFLLERRTIFATVSEKKDEGSTFCSMCAKLRRGVLYGVADKIGATKLALGHHLNDAVETLLLNLFFGGKIAALPPVLNSNAGHVPILRPLLYCDEASLSAYAQAEGFPIVGCACPICPTHPDHEFSDLKRTEMKKLLAEVACKVPNFYASVRGALQKLEPGRFLDTRFAENILPSQTRKAPSGTSPPTKDLPSNSPH